MKKVIEFLKKSNRWKHLAGGFLIGLCACGVWSSLYSSVIGASCLELKDRLWGGKWDWTDWVMTVVGGVLSSFLWLSV